MTFQNEFDILQKFAERAKSFTANKSKKSCWQTMKDIVTYQMFAAELKTEQWKIKWKSCWQTTEYMIK